MRRSLVHWPVGPALFVAGWASYALGCGDGAHKPPTQFAEGPQAGNPDGRCDVPGEAQAEDTSQPDQVVGQGTAASYPGIFVLADGDPEVVSSTIE